MITISTEQIIIGLIGGIFLAGLIIATVILFRYFRDNPDIFYERKYRIFLSILLGIGFFLLLPGSVFVLDLLNPETDAEPSIYVFITILSLAFSPIIIWGITRFDQAFSDNVKTNMWKESIPSEDQVVTSDNLGIRIQASIYLGIGLFSLLILGLALSDLLSPEPGGKLIDYLEIAGILVITFILGRVLIFIFQHRRDPATRNTAKLNVKFSLLSGLSYLLVIFAILFVLDLIDPTREWNIEILLLIGCIILPFILMFIFYTFINVSITGRVKDWFNSLQKRE